jgi:hypothetical protein
MHNLFRVKCGRILRKPATWQSQRVEIGRASAAHNDTASVAANKPAMLTTDVVERDDVRRVIPSPCRENRSGVRVLTNKPQTGPGRHAGNLTRFVYKNIPDCGANSNHQTQFILVRIRNDANGKRLWGNGALRRLNGVCVIRNEHAGSDAQITIFATPQRRESTQLKYKQMPTFSHNCTCMVHATGVANKCTESLYIAGDWSILHYAPSICAVTRPQAEVVHKKQNQRITANSSDAPPFF